MSIHSPELLTAILRGTALLSVAALLVWALSYWLNLRSATTAWRAWFAVLVCGLGIAPLTLRVPWLPREEPPLETANPTDAPASPTTFELHEAAPEPAPAIEPAAVTPIAERPAPTPPVEAPRETPARAWSWPPVVVSIWVLGIMAILARGCWRYGNFLRSARACVAAPEEWSAPWRALLAAAKLNRQAPMLVSDKYGPALARLPRGYALIVPRGMWAAMDPQVREVILRHELAHYTRGDLAWSLAARWLAAPHWFNPLAHLAVRKLDEASEWACDDAATGGDAGRQIALSKTLLGLSEDAGIPGAMQAAIGGRALAVRIRRLLLPTQAKETTMRRLAIATALITCLLTAGVRVELVAQEPSEAPAAEQRPFAAIKATLPAIPREELRYDGKSFEEWQRVFRTELKTERRTEAVGAMLVFAENGYAPEAVETVIAVLNTYKPVVPNQPEHDLFRAIENMLERADPNTTSEQLLKVLNDSDSNAAQRVALTVLESSSYRDKPTAVALLKYGNDKSKPPLLRYEALFALQLVDPDNPNLIDAIRTQIADDEGDNDYMLRRWMSLAVMKPRNSPYGPQGGFGGSNRTTVRPALVPILIDALLSKDRDLSNTAVESLMDTGDAMMRVLPRLLEIASGDEDPASTNAKTAIVGHALQSPDAMQTCFRSLESSDRIRFLKTMRATAYGTSPDNEEIWLSFFKQRSEDVAEHEGVRQLAKDFVQWREPIVKKLRETIEREKALGGQQGPERQ